MFASSTKVFVSSAKGIHYLLGSWFRNPQKERKLGKKVPANLHFAFQVGMDLKTVNKKGGDERTQEDYPPSAVYYLQM